MANLYKRKGSPFYWIKYRDKGVVVQKSTGWRIDVHREVRQAKALVHQKSIDELENPNPALHSWLWVTDWLKLRYHASALTLERYESAWFTLRSFLDERQIAGPALLLREHCFEYVKWRSRPDLKQGKHQARHNTALLELRILRLIMREAVTRGLAKVNPCVQLGIGAEPRARIKPALSNADMDLIRSTIGKVADRQVRHMLETSFEIARYQGCRLSETRVNLSRVDLARGTIGFTQKGNRQFVTALHPKLVPLFERLRQEGRDFAWDPPPGAPWRWASSRWSVVFRSIKPILGPGACFHCTRVSVATRLAQGDVPLSKAKSYMGHASSLIHETYQRLRPSDLSGCTDAIG